MKRSTSIFLSLATILGIGNYIVKQNVIFVEQNLNTAQKEIFKLEESIHILNAEWSHLNEPSRLQKLVENHLNYCSGQGIQLVSIENVPSKTNDEDQQGRMVTLASAK